MVHYPTAAELTKPNAEDENGEYWDPWETLDQRCLSYSSEIDQNAIDVLRGIRDKLYCSDIAARTGMSESHVELLQSIFCGKDWAGYGTSPRGCFPMADDFRDIITAWEDYYERKWGEPASGIPTEGGDVKQAPLMDSPVAKPDAQC
jgi:hypothetical protein